MGNIITNWAQTQKAGGGVAKAVLLCLSDKAADYERGHVSMTLNQIAEIVEFSRRAIIDNLETLEERKLIAPRSKSKKSDGTNNPNSYRILCPDSIFNKVDEAGADAHEKEPGAPDALSEADKVQQAHYPGASPALPRDEKEAKILQENAQGAPDALCQPGAPAAPSTVFKEEELNNYNSLSPCARRELTPDEIFEPDEIEQITENLESPTEAIKIWREVFPNAFIDGQKLADFAKVLPEVEASVWRQNLLDWRLSGWQAGNISGIIKRYERELKDWQKQQKKGENGQNDNSKPTYTDRRNQEAINRHQTIESIRARSNQRRRIP